jgi:hypothetical protein
MASRSKSQFLANMSHEIRTPLNAVMGYLQLLEQQESDPDKQLLIARMSDSAESLLKVINDILDVSKIEAGKLQLEQIPFKLVTTLEAIAEPFAFAARDKGLDFPCNCPMTFPGRFREILCDCARFSTTVQQCHQITESGFVLVSAHVSCRTDDAVEIALSVADSGPGIDPRIPCAYFRAIRPGRQHLTAPLRWHRTRFVDQPRTGPADARPVASRKRTGDGQRFYPDVAPADNQEQANAYSSSDSGRTWHHTTPPRASCKHPVWLTRYQWQDFLTRERQLLTQGDFQAADELSRIIDGRIMRN